MDGTNSFGLAVMGVPGEMTQEAALQACTDRVTKRASEQGMCGMPSPAPHYSSCYLSHQSHQTNLPFLITVHHPPCAVTVQSPSIIGHPKTNQIKSKGLRERERERERKKEIENGAP